MKYFSFLFLLWIADVQANPWMLDSLNNMLERADRDIEKIDIYLGLSRYHLLGSSQASSGLDAANEAFRLAEQISSKKYMADALCFIAMLKYNLQLRNAQDFKRALELAKDSKDASSILFATYLYVEMANHNSENGIEMMLDALQEYGEAANHKTRGNCYKTLAYRYELIGDFAKAEKYYKAAILDFIKLGTSPEIDPVLGRISTLLFDRGSSNLVQGYVYLGELYVKMGRYEDALKSTDLGIAEAEANENYSNLVWAKSWKAQVYKSLGQYKESIELLNESISFLRDKDEPMILSGVYQDIGNIYIEMGELEEGEKRLRLAYNISHEVPLTSAQILTDLASVSVALKKYEDAIRSYTRADSIYNQIDNAEGRILTKLGIAEIQITYELYDNAINQIKELLPLAQTINDYKSEFKSYINLALAYESKIEYRTAIEYAHRAHELALLRKQEKDLALTSNATLSRLFEKSGDYKDGLMYYKRFKELSDSTYTDLALQKLKEEQVNQNVAEYINEKENAEQLSLVLKSQNRLYIIVSSLLCLLLIGGAYLIFQLRKSRTQVENQNIELNELNATKDRFFGIIAHDIRSPIAALQSVDSQMNHYAKKGDTDRLIQLSSMVGGTAKRLNNLLDNLINWAMLQTKTIPNHPEHVKLSEVVREAAELFQANAAEKQITIEIDVNENHSAYVDRRAVQTITRNLLSNALKFSQKETEVKIQVTEIKDDTIIKIQDNGVGMTPQQLETIYQIGKKSESGTSGESGTGLGLVLVKELVDLNNGMMKIESSRGEGTAITISLPKN